MYAYSFFVFVVKKKICNSIVSTKTKKNFRFTAKSLNLIPAKCGYHEHR